MRGELVSPPRLKNPKIPKARQRHRPEGDGAGHRRSATSAPASCSTTSWRRRDASARVARRRRRRVAGSAAETMQDIQTRLRAREAPAAALLLALPQAAPRPLRPLPVLRRSAVDAIVSLRSAALRRGSALRAGAAGMRVVRSSWQVIEACALEWRILRHRQDLDERHARGLEGRDDPHRVARHPLRQRRLRRRALLRHAEGLGVLPARRAHAPAARLGQDLPDGLAARLPAAGSTPSSRRSAPTS